MKWLHFIYIAILALFCVSHSASASFESELRKLGEYEVIYDPENLGKPPILLKGAMFPEFESECQASSEPQRSAFDRLNINRTQNKLHLKARINHEWVDYWFELRPNFDLIKLAYRGETYFHDNEEDEHIFRMDAFIQAKRRYEFGEEWRTSLRKGFWLGKRAKISKSLTDHG